MSSANDREVEGHALLPIGRNSEDGSELSLSELEDEDWEVISKRPKEKTSLFAGRKWIIVLMAIFALITFVVAITWRSRNTPSKAATQEQDAKDEYFLTSDWDVEAAPQERHFHWNITDKTINPDGVYRPMILINDQFPGPLIRCNEGDRIIVHVDNQATNATSFHWHGLYQNGTNWMDGTVGISQCPIAPGAQFVYNFTVSGQHGSYWYHSHQSVQASDGLFGPLIVHSKDEKKLQPVEYATDRVVMVHDHYYNLTSELMMHYLEPDRENAEPVPDTALINGKNVRDCTTAPSRKCDSSSASLQNFNLDKNKNHRFRFINVGAFAEFQIQIDEHDFAVTEVDGTDVVSDTRYQRLNILPAQRYSIILTTNTTTSDSFWLRARMVTTCFAEENAELQAEVRAIIRYASSSSISTPLTLTPTSKDWSEVVELECHDMNTTHLHPTLPIPAPHKADLTLPLRSNFEIGDWQLSRGWINQSSYRPNLKSPSLHRIMHGLQTSDDFFDSSATGPSGKKNTYAFNSDRELVYQTTGIATIDIIISNFDDGAHPFHLHGYKFFVLATGSGYFNNDYSNIDITNPLRRDTATVPAFGWLLLRFVADNAGIWPFHCHVAWHSEAGLLMQFWTRSDMMKDWVVPAENMGLCEMEGLEKGGGPDDEIWFGDVSMLGLLSSHKPPPRG